MTLRPNCPVCQRPFPSGQRAIRQGREPRDVWMFLLGFGCKDSSSWFSGVLRTPLLQLRVSTSCKPASILLYRTAIEPGHCDGFADPEDLSSHAVIDLCSQSFH